MGVFQTSLKFPTWVFFGAASHFFMLPNSSGYTPHESDPIVLGATPPDFRWGFFVHTENNVPLQTKIEPADRLQSFFLSTEI